MAKHVVTTTEYIDDIDGGKASGTVRFGVNGASYEIDLSRANSRALEKVLRPYIDAGRKVREGRNKRPVGPRNNDLSTMRVWARSNGYTVADRGRVSQEIRDAYSASALRP